MKTVWLVLGILASLFTFSGVLHLIGGIVSGAPGSIIAASFVPTIFGLIAALKCFQKMGEASEKRRRPRRKRVT